MKVGYFLSSEESTPAQLIEQATLAEQAGFDALWISDHFHPWNDAQGQSPFVWSVIGALSQACSLPVTTAVTCPIMRMHPAIVAQAAATSATLLDGRFRLGVGTGEALNEHIFGNRWPPAPVRLEMLREAIELIRELWTGSTTDFDGRFFRVENARIYTLPEKPPPISVSGFGPESTALAAEVGDGYVTTSPDTELLDLYRFKARTPFTQAGFKVCVAPTVDEAVDAAHRLWSTSGLPGELAQDPPTPRHFEQVSTLVTRDMTAKAMSCGPTAQPHIEAFAPFVEARLDEVYVANTGPHFKEMISLFGEEVLPAVRAA